MGSGARAPRPCSSRTGFRPGAFPGRWCGTAAAGGVRVRRRPRTTVQLLPVGIRPGLGVQVGGAGAAGAHGAGRVRRRPARVRFPARQRGLQGRLVARGALDDPGPALARCPGPGGAGGDGSQPLRPRRVEGGVAQGRDGGDAQGAPCGARAAPGRRIAGCGGVAGPARAVNRGDAQIPEHVERGRAEMERVKERALQTARRVGKGAAALALHYSGARQLLSAVQRRAVGGRRVLILSYHRVVADFADEAKRSLYTLNVEQKTFRRHLEVLQESHDVVPLDDALAVLQGTRQAARDVAVVTFDDGYRDVYTHAFPVLRDLRIPGVVYVPSSFIGSGGRLGHDRLFAALRRMKDRGIVPMAVGVGNPGERWLIDAFDGSARPEVALERLIARYPTPGLLRLADALEDRLGVAAARPPEGELAMSWGMLREMDAHGVITGAYTAEHTVLSNQRLDEARS